MHKFLQLTLSLLFCSSSLFAQNSITMSDLPYFCDFEDDAENAKWVLNPGIENITTTNAWCIGGAKAYTGEKSLYISCDGGQTNTYATTHNILVAYRDISLERGQYDIAFDWTGMGNGSNGYLKIVFESIEANDIKCLGNSVEPSWVTYATPMMGNNTRLEGADMWEHVEATITIPKGLANSQTTRLLFVWVNNESQIATPTSVVIDNFQLAKASPTGYPNNIHVTTFLNTSTVRWDGKCDGYEVLYRKKTEEQFHSATTDTTSVDLKNVEYGAYEFWICGVNGTDKTIYTIFRTVYLYETDCFDVLNMYNATFEYGTWEYNNAVQKTISGTTRVDYGPDDIRSRHTTHFDTTEIDPRTLTVVDKMVNGKKVKDTISLHTVPQSEYGSVRIGNWETGSEYESITFSYDVESGENALLLLRYAIVMENPSHNATDQPRFTLDITDMTGQPIKPETCTSEDFHAPTETELKDPETKALWHVSREGIYWQEWRTIGINLDDYIGKRLLIKFTSYDCDQSGHYGYAYFTLKCSRSDVDGLPWGDDAQAQVFTAPDGFKYAWFNVLDTLFKDTLCHERTFEILSSDTNTYVCHATYLTKPKCGFTFDASAKLHNPIAEIQYKWMPTNCQNRIWVRNASHIGLKNPATGEIEHRYDKRIEACTWTMPNGQTTDSLYYDGFFVNVPNEGASLPYKIWAGVYVNDSLFRDSTTLVIDVPAIGPIETHIDSAVCEGARVEFPAGSKQMRATTGTYTDSLVSLVTGCDSIVFLHLEVIEPVYIDIADTILQGTPYRFADREYTEAGDYKAIFISARGCDSVVTLHLYVLPRLKIALQSVEEVCADDQTLNVIFSVLQGAADTCYVLFADDSHQAGWRDTLYVPSSAYPVGDVTITVTIPANMLAGWYLFTLRCTSKRLGSSGVPGEIVLRYPASIIQQRWDDVLGILNEEYNGGFKFSAFQWYKNGEPIEGANTPYYYAADKLDKDATYSVSLVREGEERSLMSCEQTVANYSMPAPAADTAQKVLHHGRLYIIMDDRTYDALGQSIRQIAK